MKKSILKANLAYGVSVDIEELIMVATNFDEIDNFLGTKEEPSLMLESYTKIQESLGKAIEKLTRNVLTLHIGYKTEIEKPTLPNMYVIVIKQTVYPIDDENKGLISKYLPNSESKEILEAFIKHFGLSSSVDMFYYSQI